MALSAEERATIIANNKSLRVIKNELEGLLERGVVSEEQYDSMIAFLPAEAPLRANPASTTSSNAHAAGNAANVHQTSPQPSLNDSIASLSVNNNPAPDRTPSAQGRGVPPPPPPPRQAELCHAIAMYAYNATDAGDLALQRDDHISVTEYMNADWWSGTNIRTRQEGIFPKNYVRTEAFPSSLAAPGLAGHQERSGYASPPPQYGGYPGQQVYGGYHAPAPQNPYNQPIPPMAVANPQPVAEAQPGQPGRGQAMATKFGRKLGNAAIFGAGATLGGDIVNSIF